MTDNKLLFTMDDADNNLQAAASKGDKTIYFTAINEWCGCTETGFGATVDVELSIEDAKRLASMIQAWLSTLDEGDKG